MSAPGRTPRSSRDVFLIGDVGGTNCRLALMDSGGRILARRDSLVRDHPTPESAIGSFLADSGQESPRAVAVAVAGPIANGTAVLTNAPWRFDQRLLCETLGFEEALLINDLAAQARAVAELAVEERLAIGPMSAETLTGTIAVVGPGTGLGVARLEMGPPIRAVPTEGGHVGFAPSDATERAILERLAVETGGRVSNEHVLSGPGLIRLRRAIAAMRGEPASALEGPAIVQLGLSGEDTASAEALERFCVILGAVCADLVLAQGATAMALVGSIPLALAPVLRQGGFRARFDAQGPRPGFLAAVPCFIVSTPDLGFKGAFAALQDHFTSRDRP